MGGYKSYTSIEDVDRTKGSRCYECSVCFQREHGYPVLCKWCWGEWYPKIKKKKRLYKKDGRKYPLRKATIPEIDGIETMNELRMKKKKGMES